MNAQIITADEMIESLTGFEEIAIAKAFGGEVFDLAQTKQTTFLRALVFVQAKREGMKDSDAKQYALGLTLKDVNARFSDPEVDVEAGEGVPLAG